MHKFNLFEQVNGRAGRNLFEQVDGKAGRNLYIFIYLFIYIYLYIYIYIEASLLLPPGSSRPGNTLSSFHP